MPLDTTTLAGQAFPFVTSTKAIVEVRFYLDDPKLQGSPIQIERITPYDFTGTASNGTAKPFQTTQVPDGTHSISALVMYTDGTSETLTGVFPVINSTASLSFNPTSMPRLSNAAWD
jgi:hypothetical protein